ncbi:MAG: amidohydrolase, partial [Firmicutes bacterium]|nr:amidohydrolase [Bacillota bacterium]
MLKDSICKHIDSKKDKFTELSDRIWDHPEIGLEEFYSAQAIMDVLKEEGFTVESGLSGIETAFKGTWGEGHPIVGFLGEYDALAGMSQKALSVEKEPVEEGCPGHGCGHNLLGAGALEAAVALRDYMEAEGIPGTVVYFGCPAEETIQGKALMIKAGCFDGVDVCLAWHPANEAL